MRRERNRGHPFRCHLPGNDRVGRREGAPEKVSFLLEGRMRAERDRYPAARAGRRNERGAEPINTNGRYINTHLPGNDRVGPVSRASINSRYDPI